MATVSNESVTRSLIRGIKRVCIVASVLAPLVLVGMMDAPAWLVCFVLAVYGVAMVAMVLVAIGELP